MTWIAESAMLAYGWRRFLMLLVAGSVAGVSVPPLFLLPALFIAFPIWIWALDGAERRTGLGRVFGPAFTIGFAFGLGYFTVALHWIGAAFLLEGGGFVALAPLAVIALAALLALFWAFASAFAHLCWSDGPWRIVAFAGLLTLAELARGHLFSGFPFDLLGYALTANDQMSQLASIVGVYGLTFLAALLSATPALIWPADGRTLTRRLVPFFGTVVVIAAQVGYGGYRLANTAVAERTDMKMRLVQPAIYEHEDWSRADPATIMDGLISLSQTQTGPDNKGLAGITQLVWPESVFPFFLSQYPPALARIARMLPPETTLLTGAPRESWDSVGGTKGDSPGFNSILAIDTDGEIVASYDKSHLVPFGEYLPLADVFRLFGIRQLVPGTNGWAPGDGRRLMAPPDVPAFIALICYEAVFPGDLGADPAAAQFILNITNDAWFDGSIGPAQHAHHARLRSVESGLPMVRVGNTGVTMLVDPLGRITARLPEQQRDVLDVVPAQKLDLTVFDRFGNWPALAAALIAIAVGIATRTRPVRKRA